MSNEKQLDEKSNPNAHSDLGFTNEGNSNSHARGNLETNPLGSIEIHLPVTLAESWDLVISELNRSCISAARAGYILQHIKQEVGHGSFLEELDRRGIHERDAQNCMQISATLRALTPDQRKQLTTLGKTKLLALSRLPRETVEELANGEAVGEATLDDIAMMSARELQTHARELRVNLENEKMRRILAQEENAERPRPAWPQHVMEIREESSIAAQNAGLCLDELDRLLGLLGSPLLILDPGDQGAHQFSAAATTLYQAIYALWARASYLLGDFTAKGFEQYAQWDSQELELLSPDEAKKVYQEFTRTLRRQEAAKEDREKARERKAGKGKVGRPKESKNKK